jgi:amino acid permease
LCALSAFSLYSFSGCFLIQFAFIRRCHHQTAKFRLFHSLFVEIVFVVILWCSCCLNEQNNITQKKRKETLPTQSG